MTPDRDRFTTDSSCPPAEDLARYVEGTLAIEARADVERHLSSCEDCRMVAAETVAFLAPAREAVGPAAGTPPGAGRLLRFPGRAWRRPLMAALLTAAALFTAVRLLNPPWLPWARPDPAARSVVPLVAAFATESTRPVQGRLSGGFKYAPPPPVTRGGDTRSWRPETQEVLDTLLAPEAGGRERHAATGVAALVTGRLDDAIAALTTAADRDPADPRVPSDLSAAYMERARFGLHAGDWAAAVRSADRALAIQPGLHEALFNRALALEGASDRDGARRAWEEYRRADPAGPWSDEAGRHLAMLQGSSAAAPRLTFQSVTDLQADRPPRVDGKFEPWVNLGRVSTDFPASFFAFLTKEACSATLIGPTTILTAAHCLSANREGIGVSVGAKSFMGVCDRAPGFRTVDKLFHNDWALCKMKDVIPLAAEVVNTDAAVVKTGRPVVITGFGCDFSTGLTRSGVRFQIGVVTVTNPSVGGTDLIQARSEAGVTLCPGDSGGGTFTAGRSGSGRVQVAVNSMTDQHRVSLMSSLASNSGRKFLFHWSQCSGTRICGIDADAAPCRLKAPPPNNVKRVPITEPCPNET